MESFNSPLLPMYSVLESETCVFQDYSRKQNEAAGQQKEQLETILTNFFSYSTLHHS